LNLSISLKIKYNKGEKNGNYFADKMAKDKTKVSTKENIIKHKYKYNNIISYQDSVTNYRNSEYSFSHHTAINAIDETEQRLIIKRYIRDHKKINKK
jgi:hypothetical protein